MHTKIVLLLFIVLFTQCTSYQVISITPNSEVNVQTSNKYDYAKVELFNRSKDEVEVRILDENEKKTGGFGIAPKALVDINLQKAQSLLLVNNTERTVKVRYKSKEGEPVTKTEDKYVSFTLRNNSASSIALIIPNVMNPNLSPMSNSGVDLKVGQEILFRVKGKNYVLLKVDESYANRTLQVADLLKKRKAELGL